MAKPRESAPDMVYHVFAHSIPERELFGDDHERRRFMTMLLESKQMFGFSLYAFCLMSNHFHLLIRTAATGITEIFHSLLTRYAWLYNTRRGRRGPVFDGRFKSPPILSDGYLMAVARYIHMNPVKAGIIQDPSQWRWSSHNAYMTGWDEFRVVDREEALSWFGDDLQSARAGYRAFLDRPSEESDVEIETALRAAVEPLPMDESRVRTLDELAREVCVDRAVSLDQLRGASQARAISEVRRAFAAAAVRGGIKAADVARFLGRPKSLISRFVREEAAKSEQ